MLLDIAHPSGEIFTYNVDQAAKPWPVPVLLVAPKDADLLRPAPSAAVSVRAAYRRDVKGRNIVARLDRGRGKWLVISTPVTSWFTSTCERGPGIAGFLAMARLAKEKFHRSTTSSSSRHRATRSAMAAWSISCSEGAPTPAATAAWAHFGSSLACRDPVVRAINSSASLAPLVDRHFAGSRARDSPARRPRSASCARSMPRAMPTSSAWRASHKYLPYAGRFGGRRRSGLLQPMAKAFADTLAAIR